MKVRRTINIDRDLWAEVKKQAEKKGVRTSVFVEMVLSLAINEIVQSQILEKSGRGDN